MVDAKGGDMVKEQGLIPVLWEKQPSPQVLFEPLTQ